MKVYRYKCPLCDVLLKKPTVEEIKRTRLFRLRQHEIWQRSRQKQSKR